MSSPWPRPRRSFIDKHTFERRRREPPCSWRSLDRRSTDDQRECYLATAIENRRSFEQSVWLNDWLLSEHLSGLSGLAHAAKNGAVDP